MGHRIVVTDNGPIIHLSEIGQIECLNLFRPVCVPSLIYEEIKAKRGPGFGEIEGEVFEIKKIIKKDDNLIETFSEHYILSRPDASVLALAYRMGAEIVFTDDLDLRDAVKSRKMTPVGTIGILLRAYREGQLSNRKLNEALDDLLDRSSLFITKELIAQAKKAIKRKTRYNK